MSERTYTYGIPGELSPPAYAALRIHDDGYGELTVMLRTPLLVQSFPLVHEQVIVQSAELDWWRSTATMRTPEKRSADHRRPPVQMPGPKRLAEMHRVDLWLDSGRCLCLPVTMHRPLVAGATIRKIHLSVTPRGRRRPLAEIKFVLEASEVTWNSRPSALRRS